MKLIDKDELEAFLNELRENLGDSDYDRGYLCAIDSIFGCYLNSLEVREVDFEKIWKEYFKYRGDVATVNVKHLAKDFYELGLYCSQTDVSYIDGVKGSYTTTDKD